MCAVILREVGEAEEVCFVHPKDIQDGSVKVTADDVLAGVPFVKGCKLWFDNHSSESERVADESYDGAFGVAPSAARLIYDYYNGESKMPHLAPVLDGLDNINTGNLSIDDILYPREYSMLGFVLDPRTGLERHSMSCTYQELMYKLVEDLPNRGINEVLQLPYIKERIDLYTNSKKQFKEMLKQHTQTKKQAIVTDLRDVDDIVPGNRFMVYTLYPSKNISLWIVKGKLPNTCAISMGHSVINRNSDVNVGSIMLRYGGGGHPMVGGCQVPEDKADAVIGELLEYING